MNPSTLVAFVVAHTRNDEKQIFDDLLQSAQDQDLLCFTGHHELMRAGIYRGIAIGMLAGMVACEMKRMSPAEYFAWYDEDMAIVKAQRRISPAERFAIEQAEKYVNELRAFAVRLRGALEGV